MKPDPKLEEELFELNVGRVGTGSDRHERPHKPVLILTILDLIATCKARPEHVPWSQELRGRFREYFSIVQTQNDECNPELPFYHLRNEIDWEPKRLRDGHEHPLESPPSVGDASHGSVFGVLNEPTARYVVNSDSRARIRALLVSRFFPHHRGTLEALFQDRPQSLSPTSEKPDAARVREDTEPTPGRSAAFARIIREAYDYQCAACGLRIRLENDLTFIDAAHLIPFGQSFNDHPTNGIALCKNHHWAMDRSLLAPSTTFIWKVASHLDPRRSPGEAEILRLAGKALLLPRDEAYHPNPEALRWREERVR